MNYLYRLIYSLLTIHRSRLLINCYCFLTGHQKLIDYKILLMATQTQPKEKLEATSSQPIPVTVDNFKRAESDMYFTTTAVKQKAIGKFYHFRELFSVDDQT